MHLPSPYALVATLGLATTLSAFLIPLEISNAATTPSVDTLDPLTALLADRTEIVDLNCPGCPFALRATKEVVVSEDGPQAVKQGLEWVDGVDNDIHLEFAVDEYGFQVNGQQIFPSTFPSNSARPADFLLTARQVNSHGELSATFPVEFTLEVLPAVKPRHGHKQDVEIIPMEFTILGLNGIPVKVETVVVHLIHTVEDGKYTIVNITKVPFNETPGALSCEASSNWSLCRIKAMFAERVRGMMEGAKTRANAMHGWMKKPGCGRKGPGRSGIGRPGRHGHHGQEESHEQGPHHFKFGHHGHHGHHHSHKLGHRLGHMLHQTLRFFIIPALLGVIGGLMASAVGMLVGQAIVYMWLTTYRGGQRANASVVEREVAVAADEKDGLLEEPPTYEDVRADVEAMGDEKH